MSTELMKATKRFSRSSVRTPAMLVLALLLAGCAAASPPRTAVAPSAAISMAPQDPLADQRAFFENVRSLCGKTFGGRTILAPAADRTFEPARLYLMVKQCEGDEIRIPFTVGDDASRTLILQMRKDGLRFVHEHLAADGTEHERSGFGGQATERGSPVFQSFPDFRVAAERPPGESQVWRLRLDTENALLLYYLDIGSQPLYRLAFHLGPASPPLQK